MTGSLRVRMSQDWRALGYAPDPIETARIEARIPSGHYLYVSTVGRRPNEWRVRLFRDPLSEPIWDETAGGTCVHAIHVALARHEAVVATDAAGYVRSIE